MISLLISQVKQEELAKLFLLMVNCWDFADISRSAHIIGDTQDEVLVGSYGIDFIDGKGGADTLSGKEGSDIYIYKEGYGHLTINDDITYAGNNDGIDLIRFGRYYHVR